MNVATITRLDNIIAAVCPIDGVSVGVFGDSATVKIWPKPSATQQQLTAAAAALAAFDWSDAATQIAEANQEPDLRSIRDQAAVAVAAIDAYLVGADTATAVQVRAEVKAIDQRQKAVISALVRMINKLVLR